MPAVEMSLGVRLLLCPKGDLNLLGRGEGAGKMEEELAGGRWEERCKLNCFSAMMSWQQGTSTCCQAIGAGFEALQLFPVAAGSCLTR